MGATNRHLYPVFLCLKMCLNVTQTNFVHIYGDSFVKFVNSKHTRNFEPQGQNES